MRVEAAGGGAFFALVTIVVLAQQRRLVRTTPRPLNVGWRPDAAAAGAAREAAAQAALEEPQVDLKTGGDRPPAQVSLAQDVPSSVSAPVPTLPSKPETTTAAAASSQRGLTLVTSYWAAADDDADVGAVTPVAAHRSEIEAALVSNLANGFLSEVVVLLDSASPAVAADRGAATHSMPDTCVQIDLGAGTARSVWAYGRAGCGGGCGGCQASLWARTASICAPGCCD
jgi:hypothetical protein